MPAAAATEQPLLSAFEVAADMLRGLLVDHADLGELRTKAHRYGLKAWLGGPMTNAPKEHYEAQVVGPAHVPGAKVLGIEVGFHVEDKDEAKNDAILDALLAHEKRWRKELGGGPDAVHAGVFLGAGRLGHWRRISETWPDPDLGHGDLAFELAARLCDYMVTFEPLRKR
ncbi:MAG TPA: hypothetical protein VEA78_03785 [Acidimicrobiales bacterium]|nr:hypothetical protein [Acidimicrobiales bacterium]